MKVIWRFVGRTAWWLAWPVWWVYFRATPSRARVLIIHGNEVLLVRGWLGSGEYELPGGGRHLREALPKAAVREVREELKMVLRESELKPLCKGTYTRHGMRIEYVTFVTKLASKLRMHPRRLEIDEAVWVPIKDVGSMRVKPDVRDSLAVYLTKP
jgi:8-oxo-dGTP pyrophosphatase MutT (NUDIX family)